METDLKNLLSEHDENMATVSRETRLEMSLIGINNTISMCKMALKQQNFDLVEMLLEYNEDVKKSIENQLKGKDERSEH